MIEEKKEEIPTEINIEIKTLEDQIQSTNEEPIQSST